MDRQNGCVEAAAKVGFADWNTDQLRLVGDHHFEQKAVFVEVVVGDGEQAGELRQQVLDGVGDPGEDQLVSGFKTCLRRDGRTTWPSVRRISMRYKPCRLRRPALRSSSRSGALGAICASARYSGVGLREAAASCRSGSSARPAVR